MKCRLTFESVDKLSCGAAMGSLHMSLPARLPRSRFTPISFVKNSMCSYEKAGQPSYRDLGFYDQDLGNRDENFSLCTLHPSNRDDEKKKKSNTIIHFRDRTDNT